MKQELNELEKLKQENEKLKKRVKELSTPTGTNMLQIDYEKLEKAANADVGHTNTSTLLTDEEAKVLVNSEFGFEASRIVILREAEINDSEPDSRYVKIKKIPRRPLYESSDWNYVRFNVRGCAGEWYYEMLNGCLYQVSI